MIKAIYVYLFQCAIDLKNVYTLPLSLEVSFRTNFNYLNASCYLLCTLQVNLWWKAEKGSYLLYKTSK